MKHSETLAALAPALVKALAAIGGVAKSADNPFFKSKYATLEAVIEASKPHLTANGLTVLQFPGAMQANAMTLETVIIHESGEWISGAEAFGVTVGKNDPQGVGSALTYARRYAQMAALNMPAVDDDGESAMSRPANQSTAPAKVTPGPEGPDWWGCSGFGMTASAAKKEGLGDKHGEMLGQIDALSSGDEWRTWCRTNLTDIARMPQSWRVILRERAEAIAMELGVDLNAKRAA